MLLKKCVKNRRKLKILLLFIIIVLIVATIVLLNSSPAMVSRERLLDERFIAAASANDFRAAGGVGGGGGGVGIVANTVKQDQLALVQSQQERAPIMPEKYDEHKIKTRIIKDKIKYLTQQQQQQQNSIDPEEEHTVLDVTTTAIHIFYSAPVQWYKTKKPAGSKQQNKHQEHEQIHNTTAFEAAISTPKSLRILNTAFYPALGLYKPTVNLLQKHFENIRNCGIGVIILAFTGRNGESELYEQILNLVPQYNLSVTFELSLSNNQSQSYVREQLTAIRRYVTSDGLYRVHSLSRNNRRVPLLYVSNAYKLSGELGERIFCPSHLGNERRTLDAYFIGHIRLKSHADALRRLCFDGFYSKLPSNGATYASTWKNWSYLKSFAQTYKMLFVPTVGPGFAERNKFPRHGDIQRHRSNGRYYGVAWRSAIINHVGIINIASYNNWQDGSQIEEVIPKAGFLDYNPGTKTKYLDLTTHWVGNFLKQRRDAANAAMLGKLNCYELLNNTIC